MNKSGALVGIRVIDFGQYISAPLAAMLLADQGADVIRVDPPGGPRHRTPANATWNRGKRSIVLDLKQAGDRDIARRLVLSADVVIENFRPGVMSRLDLDAKEMTRANPRLVYCSLPGFAADDPRVAVAAWEGIIGAATATYHPHHAGERPIYTAVPISSVCAAFQAAVSITMALNARERCGAGQMIEIPLYDATFTAMGSRAVRVHDKKKAAPSFTWSRPFQCKDGRWLHYQPGNKKFGAFKQSLGAADWVKQGMSVEEQERRAEDIFRTRTAKEWEDYCAGLETEGAICLTQQEWMQHPQALASGILQDFEDPEIGKFRGPGINVRMSDTPGRIAWPRPVPDAHGDEIRRELSAAGASATATPVADPVLAQALKGVRVLDLCIVLAGPICGRTLAEYGADVIKIDSTFGDSIKWYNESGRAKRSILLNLQSPEGLAVFWKLVDSADVVLQNFRKGVADRLGIGYEAIKARRPGIVYASMNVYGQAGPYADRPGHDTIAQASTGIQDMFGGDVPTALPYAINDYGTGLMGCYGVALALLHRSRTGKGQHVDSALCYTATILQSGMLQDFPGKQWTEPRGQDALGRDPLYRMYQAGDGWLFLAAGARGQLAKCPELSDLANLQGEALEQALEARIAKGTVSVWEECLRKAGIGAHRVIPTIGELMEDKAVRERGLSVTREHDDIGLVTTVGTAVRMSKTPLILGRPAPRPGSDALSVLKDVGLQDELDSLIRAGAMKVDGKAAG